MFRTGLLLVLTVVLAGCAPRFSLFGDFAEPLREYPLQGEDRDNKIAVIHVRGFITTDPDEGLVRDRPGPVQETVAHLKKAQGDDAVKAVVLMVDSPGGTVTASDVLFAEIEDFRQRSGCTVVVLFLNLGTSGAYYMSLAADRIMAHPSTITGSVGTIFIRPKVYGLMDKLGLDVEVTRSGEMKDMGSPFRETTEDEADLFQEIIDRQNARFLALVEEKRGEKLRADKVYADGRVLTSDQALDMGLIDGIGYFRDAVDQARETAGLPKDPLVVVYRRCEYHDDNVYNPMTGQAGSDVPRMIEQGLARYLPVPRTGLYYLWAPEFR